MNTEALREIATLAAIEIGGICLLALGMWKADAVWALPVILIGSLLLCIGITQAIKLIIASIKAGSKAK